MTEQISDIRRYLLILLAHILRGNRSAVRANVSTNIFAVYFFRSRKFVVMPRCGNIRIILFLALRAMEFSLALNFAMRFAHDFRFIIVSGCRNDVIFIFVSARQAGVERITFVLASCDKIRIGEFMSDRFQDFRLYAIFTTAAFLSAIAFFRTSRRNFDFFIVVSERRHERIVISRPATRTDMRCIALLQTSRFYEFRLIIVSERTYDFRFGLRTARAFPLLYSARRTSRLRQTCPFSEIVSRCVCIRVRIGMSAPFALVDSVSAFRTGRIYNDVFITMTERVRKGYNVAKLDDVIGDNNEGAVELPSNRPYGYTKYPTGMDGVTNCICYPIYKNGVINSTATSENVIIFSTKLYGENKTIEIILDDKSSSFEKNNNTTSYYYTKKISIVPPFDRFWTDSTISIDENNCLIISALGQGSNVASVEKYNNTRAGFGPSNFFINPGNGNALIFGSVQKEKELFSYDYFMTELNSVAKSEIIAPQSPNLAYNPKLNGQNFKELVITAANGDTFAYDIQKINSNDILFMYSEPIQPEITRYYMRLKPTGLYLTGTEENYTGLVGSTDNGLAFTNDAYAAFIANNKNFFMQSNLKIGFGAVKSTAGVISQAASGKAAGAVGSGISAGLDVAQTLIDRSMTVDNMKNAPDQLKNANGNVIFNMFATDLGLYVEKYSALEGDLKTANDFMNLYGFTFNSIANVKDYAHIRKYHNYVKAQLQGIVGNISNTARDDLRQRFASGIRFWNQDNISYQYENYEFWLED